VVGSLPPGMTRKTIFSELPYYEDLPIFHMFDTMHIGNNFFVCLYNMLFEKNSVHGRKLNKLQVRMDLKEVGRMPHLWPDDNGNFADDPWSLSKEGKGQMIKSIKSVRFPTSFGVNFKKVFTKGNELIGMKTHDWHNFLRVCKFILIDIIYIINYIFLKLFFFIYFLYFISF